MAAGAALPLRGWGAYEQLRWWLVDNPTVSSFEWSPGRTAGASASFVSAAIATYLTAVLVFHRRLVPLPSPPPALLRRVSAAHNAFLLLLSAVMAAGCALSALTRMPSPRWLFCFPPSPSPSPSPSSGPVFFWAYVFYLSKLYELLDTLLILLSGEGGRRRRLTFLHVYHHAVVVAMCYVWLATSQSLVPIALVTNAGVHVVMYAYYLSSCVGWRWPPRWKRAVTEIQIAQFVFSFAASAVFLWYYFFDPPPPPAAGPGPGPAATPGCRGMSGWLFNAAFNASLFVLFLNFHTRAYSASQNNNKTRP